MKKEFKIVILILFGALFNYAGMYIIGLNLCSTILWFVDSNWICLKCIIGTVGIAFGNYIFFEAGRLVGI